MQRMARRLCGAGLCVWWGACAGSGSQPQNEDGAVLASDAQVGDASVGHDASAHDAGAQDASRDAGGETAGGVDAGDAAHDARVDGDTGPAAEAGSDASGDCPVVFCEDFESGELAAARWTKPVTDNPANSVKVQRDVVTQGNYAAQFHAKGGSTRALVFNENLPQALRQHYFGRLRIRISDFPSEGGGHSAFVLTSAEASADPSDKHHFEVGVYNEGSPIWQLTYWTGDGPEYIGSGGQIPKNSWFCLEWEFNDAPDQIAVWVDGDGMTKGAAFRDINNHASGLLGQLGTLGVGFRTWHQAGAPDIDVYIDDIALDTKRVGCQP